MADFTLHVRTPEITDADIRYWFAHTLCSDYFNPAFDQDSKENPQ